MLDQKKVFETLSSYGVSFFAGVPDSYLNGFCDYALNNCGQRNIIAANEGNAVAIGAGHYIATKQIPLIYMQNSGIGNAFNPIISLIDEAVYSIPMILMIGWRGKDYADVNHPQHSHQGKITIDLLELLEIPYSILTDDENAFEIEVSKAVKYCREMRRSYAFVVPKGIMSDSTKNNIMDTQYPLSRDEVIEIIIDALPDDTIFTATTGRVTRELFYIREKRGEKRTHDFLNLGAMGHLSSIALGIAQSAPERRVVALDGDGAAIMHLGALTMVSKVSIPNFIHIVLNHGSVFPLFFHVYKTIHV